MIPVNRQIIQHAWVVKDTEQTIKKWVDAMGVGPFFINSHVTVEDLRYMGEPSELDMTVTLAYAGEVQIELIEVHSKGPSAFADAFPDGGEGFHHVAVFTEKYDEDLARYEKLGYRVPTTGVFGDMRFCYIDTRPGMNVMVELLEESAAVRAHFAPMRAAAEDWDGVDPIRMV